MKMIFPEANIYSLAHYAKASLAHSIVSALAIHANNQMAVNRTFAADKSLHQLRADVQETKPHKPLGDWIRADTWKAIAEKRRQGLKCGSLRTQRTTTTNKSNTAAVHEEYAVRRRRYQTVRRVTVALLQRDRKARMDKMLETVERLMPTDGKRAWQVLSAWYKRKSGTNLPLARCEMEAIETEYGALFAKNESIDEIGEPPPNPVGNGFGIKDKVPSEDEIRVALGPMRNGKAPGPTGICTEDIKRWATAARKVETVWHRQGEPKEPEIDDETFGAALHWSVAVDMVQEIFQFGDVPPEFSQAALVLIPKQEPGKFRRIALLETLYKLTSAIINRRINSAVSWHKGVHGFWRGRSCTTAIAEAKVLVEATRCKGEVLFLVFLDLTKAYDTVDRDRLFTMLEHYGLGPRCIAVLRNAWNDSGMVPKRDGRFGKCITTTRGVRQGDIISPTLFNILVDAVLRLERERLREVELSEANLPLLQFYADDGLIGAGVNPDGVQASLDAVVEIFERFGIDVNVRKTKWMFVAGKHRVHRIQHGTYCNVVTGGRDSYIERGREMVSCPVCHGRLQRRCVQRHIQHSHPESVGPRRIDFYSPTPVRASGPRNYVVCKPTNNTTTACPVPFCPYEAGTSTALRRHFAARHPVDEIHVLGELGYVRCTECNQYVKGPAPTRRHLASAICQNGKRKFDSRKAADALAEQLANLPQFFVKGKPIGQVSSFTYLGRVLNSEDDDLEACQRNIERSRAKWGALSRLLRSQRASLAMRTRMYLVVVSTVLLYGSETWTFTPRMQQLLTSFHVGCARHLTRMYVHPTYTEDNPEDLTWVYPSAASTFQRCGLQPIMHYVNLRRERFYLTYLKFSPTYNDSTKQTTAGHVRNFNRFHQQYTQFDCCVSSSSESSEFSF